MPATLSILGLYKYDPTLFENLVLPEDVDSSTAIATILLNVGKLEAMYPDADFMKEAIGYWSNSRLNNWERMALVLFEDYDPFLNIKRDEVRRITQDMTNSQTDTSSGTSIDNVNAWNDQSADGVQRGKTSSTASGTTQGTGKIITEETFHVEGDSAITDAQDVLRKEMDVRADFNIYEIIADDFKKQFCLLVY